MNESYKISLSIFFLISLSLAVKSNEPDKKSVQPFADQWEFVGTAISESGYHVWGTSPIMGNDGKVHLFCARWPRETKVNPGWRTHSEIAHYIGESPEGPFVFSDVVIKGSGGNVSPRV